MSLSKKIISVGFATPDQLTAYLEQYFWSHEFTAMDGQALSHIKQAGMDFIADHLGLTPNDLAKMKKAIRLMVCCDQAMLTKQIPYHYFWKILQSLKEAPAAGNPQNLTALEQAIGHVEGILGAPEIPKPVEDVEIGAFSWKPGEAMYVLVGVPNVLGWIGAGRDFGDTVIANMAWEALKNPVPWNNAIDALNGFIDSHPTYSGSGHIEET